MNKKLVFAMIVLMLTAMACSTFSIGPTQEVEGSGHVTTETRTVSGFDTIVLTGAASVNVTFGETESVVVKGDDNIVPLVETTAEGSQLVIGMKPNMSISTHNDIKVDVTMKSLKVLTLKGSGNINVDGLVAGDFSVSLPGSGNITVTGSANTVEINLPGSGNIFCAGLQAHTTTIQLAGSGNITAYASESLDAGIRGSGSIRYEGDPAKVNKRVTGTGTIVP